MARLCKLNTKVQQKIGDGVALGLTYALAANLACVTYQTFNEWMKLGRDSTSGKYFEFYKHIEQRNAEGALKILQRLNDAAEAENCQVSMFILERRFPEEFGRRVYRKMNIVSENLNQNVKLIVTDADKIRGKILEKFALVEKIKSLQLYNIFILTELIFNKMLFPVYFTQ
jgi:transposase